MPRSEEYQRGYRAGYQRGICNAAPKLTREVEQLRDEVEKLRAAIEMARPIVQAHLLADSDAARTAAEQGNNDGR